MSAEVREFKRDPEPLDFWIEQYKVEAYMTEEELNAFKTWYTEREQVFDWYLVRLESP